MTLYEDPAVHARRWWTLAVLCLSLLIVFVGNASMNVALPSLSRQLHASSSELQWIVAVYSLAFAGLLFVAGAIGDRFGRKGALQLGMLGFLVAVALASRSHDATQLIVCRGLMGASAAFMMPSTLSILVNVFPPGERAQAIAIWSGVTAAGGPIGQVASGWLLGHFWFGSIFLVNVPIVLLALVLGAVFVPKSKDPEEAKLDAVGAALSAVGVTSIVYGLIQAPDAGWGSPQTLVAFGLGALVLIAFAWWEGRSAEPMLDMAYFRNPAFSTAAGGMVLVFLAMYGVTFLFAQYLQLVEGYSPFGAAVRLLPLAPIMLIVAPMTPRVVRAIGSKRTVATGMVLAALGLLVLTLLSETTGYSQLVVALTLMSSGIALTMSPMTAAIMSAVPPRRAGAGSAMNDTTREVGAALGVAVLGSVAASRYSSAIAPALRGLSGADRDDAHRALATALQTAGRIRGDAGAHLALSAERAFVSGIHYAALTGVVLAVLAAAAVLRWLPHQIDQHGAAAGPVEAAEDVAQLGIGGAPPVFADTADDRRTDARPLP